jgi:hypothetical protein
MEDTPKLKEIDPTKITYRTFESEEDLHIIMEMMK